MPGTIHVEKIGHHVSLLTIDNPPANAMDAAMLGKLLEEFQAINDASSARNHPHGVRQFLLRRR